MNFLQPGAPAALARLLADEMPVRVLCGGQPLDLTWESSASGAWRAQDGDLRLEVRAEPMASTRGVRWKLVLHNAGCEALAELGVRPLFARFDVEPERDRPTVRHMSGSWHYDGIYPPRAFRLHEERFLTSQHCKPVCIGSGSMGSAGEHVPILQFAVRDGANLVGLFVGFEWSTTWHLQASWERVAFTDNALSPLVLEGGVGLDDFRLEPGESLELPWLHLGFFECADWDAASDVQRRYTCEELAARFEGELPTPPVSYDHWFGIHQFFDCDDLMRQAEHAAELGCEYFCLDAAWYRSPADFMSGIGNWSQPDPEKFPDGVEPLSRRVRELGMGFGLWHLIQAAQPGTEVVQSHPELFHAPGGGLAFLRFDLPAGRQLALDVLRRWIDNWHLSWMRWECLDTDSWANDLDPSGKLAIAAQWGFYEVMDSIRREYPQLYIEGCQGGGTKLDWGMTRRTHGAWLSDQTVGPDLCRFMQTGALRFWPAHYLNMALAVHRGTGDVDATPHGLLSRMVGPVSFNGDIANWSTEATTLVREYVGQYKAIRHLLGGPVAFPLPQPRDTRDWDAVLIGEAHSEARLLFVFRIEGSDNVRFSAPNGEWRQVLGSEAAKLDATGDGLTVTLPPNSSALWRLDG